jgi:murein DD-endopeptidase MepM/ murein hydrolase activator NlpD
VKRIIRWKVIFNVFLVLILIGIFSCYINFQKKNNVTKTIYEENKLDNKIQLRQIPTGYPFNGPIETKFGWIINPITKIREFHTGVDIPAPLWSLLVATANGEVIKANWDDEYGYMIMINHENGISTLYAHLAKIFVKVGDKVEFGQEIGNAGSTGTSTYSHVHYEILQDGKPVDPEKFNREISTKK